MLNPTGFLLWGLNPVPQTYFFYCWVFHLVSTGFFFGDWVLHPREGIK